MTLPDTRFYLDVAGDGSFSKDITTSVLLVNGMTIKRGREDWQGGVTAGELTITLNNSDGRFTPGSTILGSPSPIKVDQRIRVKETINGVTVTRFTGYIKQWPVAWPAVVPTFSTVTITATDAQARAERWPLRASGLQAIEALSPVELYTLGEDANATTAGDTSGNQAPPLTITGSGSPLTFGSDAGPGFDAGTAVQLTGGQYLARSATAAISAPWTVVVAFKTTSAGSMSLLYPIGNSSINMSAGNLAWAAVGIKTGVNDGNWHILAIATDASANADMYIDGSLQVTTNITTAPLVAALKIGNDATGASPFVGDMAMLSIFSQELNATQVADLSGVMLGTLVESGTARITRLAGYSSIPVGTLDASLTTVPMGSTADKSTWEALQEAADAEVGLLFFDGSGSLTLHNRNRPTAKTAPDLILDKQYLVGDVQPVIDDQQIINNLDATAAGTQATQKVRNATSETSHGRYPSSVSYLVQTDQEALDRANWIVGNFAEPTTRYGTLTINLFKMTPALAQAVLSAVELNCWLRVTSMPSQNTDGPTTDVIVEGFTERQGGDTWALECNVVSRSLFSPVWILGDSTYSVLGSTTRLYV